MRRAATWVVAAACLTLGACGDAASSAQADGGGADIGSDDEDAGGHQDAPGPPGDAVTPADGAGGVDTGDGLPQDAQDAGEPECTAHAQCPGGDVCAVASCWAGACALSPALWQVVLGGPAYDKLAGAVRLADEGLVAVGATSSEGAGGYDAWLVRTDRGGHVLWDRPLGGPGNDLALAVAALGEDVVVAGSQGGAQAAEAWVARVGADGAPRWQRSWGGPGDDVAAAVVAADLDRVAAAGWRGETPWVVALRGDGETAWERTLEGAARVHGLVALPGGHLAACGTRYDGPLGPDPFAARLGADGAPLWQVTVPGPGQGHGRACAAHPGGGVIVAGWTDARGDEQAWAAHLDAQGQMVWERTWGSAADERAEAIVATGPWGWALGGRQAAAGGPSDGWVLQLDPTGQRLWERALGGAGDDAVAALVGGGAGPWHLTAIGSTAAAGPGGHPDAWLRGVDAWGELACDAGSVCATLTPGDCTLGDPCVAVSCDAAAGCRYDDGTGAACDDGNPCTIDSCEAGFGCRHDAAPGACDDGDPCTGGDACTATGACAGTALACDDGDPCTDDGCDPLAGCLHAANAAPCDDGDPCTTGDTCGPAGCAGVAVACDDDGDPCTAAACDGATGACTSGPAPDGAPCDDGTLCSTGDACASGACVGQAVVCDNGNPCNGQVCDAATGGCVPGVAPDGTPCDDGDGCTVGDTCQSAACVAGAPKLCDDGNPCTVDLCGGAAKDCLGALRPEGFPCDDGEPCTSGDACAAGACASGPATACDDGDPCTDDSCVPGSGCAHAPNAAPCDDGDACTLGDACDGAGACQPGTTPVTCDDGDPCSDDRCASATGACEVVGPMTGAACDDGDVCTLGDACDGAGGCAPGGTTATCQDGNPCSDDWCDAAAGCLHAPVLLGTACEDGNPCTVGDACGDGGTCESGPADPCEDGDPCTDDSCAAGLGCQHAFNTAPCSDGDPCTVGEACDGAGGCSPGGAIDPCEDGNACTDDSCLAGVGCQHAANAAGCSDGDPCTLGDVCAAGACAPGPLDPCDDGDACTDDSCAAGLGCQHADNTAPCDDGDACTSGDACGGGTCQPGAGYACSDADPCTDDVCDGLGGCLYPSNAAACDDGDACTLADTCAGGVCAGTLDPCDDGDACTDGDCDAATGCRFTALDGTACDDGLPCTAGDTCLLGACAGGADPCDDANPCTDDTCAPGDGGCTHTDNAAPCEDGDACTAGDACDGAGACLPGGSVTCDDGDPCTTDTCDAGTGCVFTPFLGGCDDGDLCTSGDTCASGTCAGTGYTCDDSDVCTDDVCDGAGGCSHPANAAPCDDGDLCTVGDTCAGGACLGGGPLACDDGELCTEDSCDTAQGGCVFDTMILEFMPCGIDDACDTFLCTSGQCLPFPMTDCFDGNDCTDDTCDSSLGCLWTPLDGKPCDDGDVCTGPGTCSGAACATGPPDDCDDGEPCTTDSCDPGSGCQNVAVGEGAGCDDGDACTSGDQCTGGVCAGAAATCDDGDPCTDDACAPGVGCVFTPTSEGSPCDTACTTAGVCTAGTCAGGTAVTCDDGSACTNDSCAPGSGCVFTPLAAGAGCDDGKACTVDDVCDAGGLCKGAPKDMSFCDTGNPCTTWQCNAFNGGCFYFDAQDGTPCDDGVACTAYDVCRGGVCQGVSGGGAFEELPEDPLIEAISIMAGGHRTTGGSAFEAEWTLFGSASREGAAGAYAAGYDAAGFVTWEHFFTRPFYDFTAIPKASRTSASDWCVLGDDRTVMTLGGESGLFNFSICSAGQACGFQSMDATARLVSIEGWSGACLVAGYTATSPRQAYVAAVSTAGDLGLQWTFTDGVDGEARVVWTFDPDTVVLGGRRGTKPRLWLWTTANTIPWDIEPAFTGGTGAPWAITELDYHSPSQRLLAVARSQDGAQAWVASVNLFSGTVAWQRPFDGLIWRNGSAGRQLHFASNSQAHLALIGAPAGVDAALLWRTDQAGNTHWQRETSVSLGTFPVAAARALDDTTPVLAQRIDTPYIRGVAGAVSGGDLGRSVALSPTPDAAGRPVAILGNATANGSGQVEIWRFTDGTATTEVLVPPTPVANTRFGASVDLRGTIAVAGGGGFGFAPTAGSAHVFEDTGAGYAHVAELVGATTASGDQLGQSIGLTSDAATVLVGAPKFEGAAGANSGQVHVWYDIGSGWTEGPPIQPATTGAVQGFGWSLDVEGDFAAVGALGGFGSTGRAWVFERISPPSGHEPNSPWVQRAELLHPSGAPNGFGNAIAVYHDTVVVGQKSGQPALAYVRQGNTWVYQGALVPAGVSPSINYGSALALYGPLAVVGANDAGAAYVFERRGDQWVHLDTLTGAGSDQFAASVAANGRFLLSGGPLYNSRGAARLYERRWIGFVAPFDPFGRLLCTPDGCSTRTQAGCNDGLACTTDDCSGGSCVHESLEGELCSKGSFFGTCGAANSCP